MNKDTINSLTKLFNKPDARIAKALHRLSLFLRAYFAIIAHDDAQKQGYTYHTYSKLLNEDVHFKEDIKKYVPEKPLFLSDVQSATITDEMAEIIKDDLDCGSFICNFIPYAFAGDCKDVVETLGLTGSPDKQFLIMVKLYAVIEFRTKLFEDNYPTQDRGIKLDELPEKLFDAFCKWDNFSKYHNLFSSENCQSFFKLWLIVRGINVPFSSIRTRKNVSDPLNKLFRSKAANAEVMYSIFYAAKVIKELKPKGEIKNPFAYLLECAHRHDSTLNNPISSLLTATPWVEEYSIDDALKQLRNVELSDFLNAMHFSSSPDQLAIENSFIFSSTKSLVNANHRAMIINPNPDFVSKLLSEDSYSNNSFCFVFTNRELARLYKYSFPSCMVGFFSDSNQIIILDLEFPSGASAFARQFTEAPAEGTTFDYLIWFSRPSSVNLPKESLENNLESVCLMLAENADCYLLVDNASLDNNTTLFASITSQLYLRYILLLPNTQTGTGKKKSLLCLRRLSKPYSVVSPVPLVRTFLLKESTGMGSWILQEPWVVRIQQAEFKNNQFTIKSLWEKGRPKPAKNENDSRESKHFDYSEEIRIWYSWKSGFGRFSFYSISSNTSRNTLGRGKKLISSKRFRVKTEEGLIQRINTSLLEDDEWASVVRKEIEAGFLKRGKTVCLKTYWFLRKDKIAEKTALPAKAVNRLFESSLMAALHINNDVSLDTIKDIFESEFGEESKTSQEQLWRVLNRIMGVAQADKIISKNPIASFYADLSSKNKGMQAVRDALALKSYTVKQETELLRVLKNGVPENGRRVGCLISFFTGLPNNQIIPLTWKDYHEVEKLGFFQLWIYQMMKDGEILVFSMDEKQLYRRIPCVKALQEVLDARLNYVKAVVGDDYLNLPIVSEGDAGDAITRFCSPAALNAEKRASEQETDLKHVLGFIASKVETDFTEYGGDRFRMNLEHHLLQTSKMTSSEVNYLMGTKAPETYSRFYCDFLNPFVQLSLLRKMERWDATHFEQSVPFIPKEALPCNNSFSLENRNSEHQRVCIIIDFSGAASDENNRELSIIVNDSHGADLDIYKGRSEQ